MNEKSILFFPVERDGRVRQIANGVVTSLSKKTPLLNNPDGHREIALIYERNTRHGMGGSFSLPLGFVLDGERILRNDMYKFNIDRELYLLIKRFVTEYVFDGVNWKYKEYYKHFYKGEFDFSSIIDKRRERKVEISLMQGGNSKLLKAFEGVKSAYVFDDDHVNIHCTGIDLFKKANFVALNELEISNTIYGNGYMFLPLAFINTEGESFGMAFFSQQAQEVTGSFSDLQEDPNFCAESSQLNQNDVDIEIKGKLMFKCTERTASSVSLFMRFIRSNQDAGDQLDYNIFTGTLVNGETQTVDVDITVPLNPGERLYFTHFLDLIGTSVSYEFLEGSTLTMNFKNKFKDTYVKAYKPFDLYKKICQRAGIDANDVVSEKLKTCNIFITSGDALRLINGSDIKTTYNDFFKAFDVYLMLGASVEQRNVIMEERQRFYDLTDPVALGDVVLNEVSEAVELFFSSIKVGHAEQDIDDVNGKFDAFGFQIYSSPVKRIGDKELDLQSPYTASPYEIEKTRTNFDNKQTTDANTDNKVYVAVVDLASSQKIINVLLSFSTAGQYIVFPIETKIVPGMRFVIRNTVNNNYLYTVTSVDELTLTQNVFVDVVIAVAEFVVVAELEFMTGQIYEYDRSLVIDSGVPSPETMFNAPLHPYLILQKHLAWIHGVLDKYDTEKLRFEQNNRNKDMVIGGVEMKRDISVMEMPPKMFKPMFFDLTAPAPIDLPDLMETNPNRCFSFISKTKLYIGFPYMAGMAADVRPQDFKLLSSPLNNLEDLIP